MTTLFRRIFRTHPRFSRTAPRLSRTAPRLSRTALHLGVAAALAMTAGLFLGPSARAQDAELGNLLQRIERLQRDMNTLQRYVFKGEAPPAASAVTGTAGEAGGLNRTAAARTDQRLSQFETELRRLTGQVEEAVYRNNQINERLERLAAETDLRLRQLEQGRVPGAAPGAAMAPGAAGDQAAFASQPQVFGTVRKSDLDAMQSQPVTPGTGIAQQAAAGYTLVGETPQEQYKYAFGLLSQANYGEAELALRGFVDQNPSDPLAGNAKYWLGETFYVRQDYQQAAVTFAEAYQDYPDSSKAPDNLLKLGMSLSALGSQSDACGTFVELLKRYPQAAATILQRAKQERQRLSCP